jgi:hypothetical protein
MTTQELDMKRASLFVAAGLAVLLAVPVAGLAQTPSSTAPVTGMKPDRTTADPAMRKAMQEKEAMLRAKRTECRAKAKAEKVPLLKRAAYVKKCRAE